MTYRDNPDWKSTTMMASDEEFEMINANKSKRGYNNIAHYIRDLVNDDLDNPTKQLGKSRRPHVNPEDKKFGLTIYSSLNTHETIKENMEMRGLDNKNEYIKDMVMNFLKGD